MKTTSDIKDLKKGGFILIENSPCRIEKVTKSSAGKHGAAKVRVDARGLFDGKKKSIVEPAGESVNVPIINRNNAQVLAVLGERVQLMDLSDYSVFELKIPKEMKGKLESGTEINYYEVMGKKTIKKIK